MKGCEVTVWSCPYFKFLPFSWHDLQLSWLASALIKHPAGPWMAKKHQCTTLKAVFLMSTKSWQPYPMIKVMRYGCKWRHHLSPDCPAFMLTLIILYRNNRTMVDHSVHHCGIGWRGNYRHISGKRNEVIVTEQLIGSVTTYFHPPASTHRWTKADRNGSSRTCGRPSSRRDLSAGSRGSRSILTACRTHTWCTPMTGTAAGSTPCSRAAGWALFFPSVISNQTAMCVARWHSSTESNLKAQRFSDVSPSCWQNICCPGV